MRRLLLACAAITAIAAPLQAQDQFTYGFSGLTSAQLILNGGAFTLTATDQGWYTSVGFHDPTNTNYIVGTYGPDNWHDWFSFDMTGLPTITSAALQIATEQVYGGPFTVDFHDFTGNTSALWNGTGGVSAFTDLANGSFYGSQYYEDSDSFGTKTINLNAAAIADMNEGGYWTMGGSIHSDQTVTPEPTTMILLGSGLAGIAAKRRRRKAAAAA